MPIVVPELGNLHSKTSQINKSFFRSLVHYIVKARLFAPGPEVYGLNSFDIRGNILHGETTQLRITSKIARNSIKISFHVFSTDEEQHGAFITELDCFFKQASLRNSCFSLFEGENSDCDTWTCVATFKDHAAVWQSGFTNVADCHRLNGVCYEYCAYVHLEVANFSPSETPVELIFTLENYAAEDGVAWKTIKSDVLQAKVLAFAMALHTRLGSGATAHMISGDILKMIDASMMWDTMENYAFNHLLEEMQC
jgi:hypothetical protein